MPNTARADFFRRIEDVLGKNFRKEPNPLKTKIWRRGWDSNPRLGFPNTRFPSVLLQPLGHLST